MEDFGMPLAKWWEILFDKLAAENPKPKSQAHFSSFELHRFEHLSNYGCKVRRIQRKN
jgi:hypothetical protein